MTDFLQKLAKSATKITKAEMYNRLDYFDDYLIDYLFFNRNRNRNHAKNFQK